MHVSRWTLIIVVTVLALILGAAWGVQTLYVASTPEHKVRALVQSARNLKEHPGVLEEWLIVCGILDNREERFRLAKEAYRTLSKRAAPALAVMLNDGDLDVRVLVVVALGRIARGLHRSIGLAQRPLGQQFIIAGNLASRLERRRSQKFDLTANQTIQQIEIRGDAAGAGILIRLGDLFIRFACPATIKAPHLLDQHVVDQRNDRRNAVSSDMQGGVDHETRTHHGDVKGMGAASGRSCHE